MWEVGGREGRGREEGGWEGGWGRGGRKERRGERTERNKMKTTKDTAVTTAPVGGLRCPRQPAPGDTSGLRAASPGAQPTGGRHGNTPLS